ncbi:unnamed protein product [Bursaphelenchus xylophilus]|uniref:(pine wood nematode) hypothetical protein n=1 Tax=Bursaphelenchus xylophilus TaxID=6326 RepID=A0A1I7S686_BURXY|nr:unnamed protein product [Bursaphelenchus xylophilus]CAG9081123.1 unnamed protein product [Bursaphelenchus xylophilus]
MKGSYQKRFFKILSEKLAERDIYSDNVFYCLANAMQHTSDTFYRFYNSKKLRNPIIIEERNQAISQGTTGLSTWSAAYLLSNYLLQLQNDLQASADSNREFRILELGAGCGLAGIAVASHFPNIRLTTTDCDENVLQQLKANVKNNFGEENFIHEVRELDWLKTSENDVINEKFGMIIAADVIYDPELLEAFLNTVTLVLRRNSEAKAILAFKERNPDTFKLFMDTLARSKLEVTMKARTSSTDPFETKILTGNGERVMDNILPPDELLNNFWIFEMRLKEENRS